MKKKIIGTSIKPRLYVFKSNKHIYAQVIDDFNKKIIASSSTISQEIKAYATCQTAAIVGKKIADTIKKKGIRKVVFDRGKNIYHGKVKALADATREEGINF
uniref:Large ribosomal subunit protein uL18c n=1 Tax=Ptilothamnion sphaericum TaxID=1498216 RepID=A0A4D6WZ60_9FLOR|nr:ribosomal protein L18 [Ptilothamnion sphaericum]